MSEALTLEEVEKAIEQHYLFFHQVQPGVQPQETGELGALWALFDRMVA